jgi:hypothetical protein
MERCRGPRARSAGTPPDQRKGTGAAPTRDGVARPKAAVVVEMQGNSRAAVPSATATVTVAWTDDFI